MLALAFLLVLLSPSSYGDFLQCPLDGLELYLKAAGLTVASTSTSIVVTYSASTISFTKTPIGKVDNVGGYSMVAVSSGLSGKVRVNCGSCVYATLNSDDVDAILTAPSFSNALGLLNRVDYALSSSTLGNCSCIGPNLDCTD
jgi:hypothetical protein